MKKAKVTPIKISQAGGDHILETALREYLRPVKPRHEFVNRLQGKLKQDILPIQKRRVVPLRMLAEVFLRSVALFVIAVLTVRALMLIISTWKILRASGIR